MSRKRGNSVARILCPKAVAEARDTVLDIEAERNNFIRVLQKMGDEMFDANLNSLWWIRAAKVKRWREEIHCALMYRRPRK